MLMMETPHYKNILEITDLIRKKERLVAALLFLASLISSFIFFKYYTHRSLLLVAVLFYGLAVSLLFKRDLDVKLGGLSSFALLLYYTLGNLWLPVHFIIVWIIGIPLAVYVSRRGLLGPLLFYGLALILLPVSLLSYEWFGVNYHYSLIPQTFDAQEVIYVFLPMVYVHTSLSVKKSLILRDTLVFFGLLIVSVVLWWGINYAGRNFL